LTTTKYSLVVKHKIRSSYYRPKHFNHLNHNQLSFQRSSWLSWYV